MPKIIKEEEMKGLSLIVKERFNQLAKGRTIEKDVELNSKKELAEAAQGLLVPYEECDLNLADMVMRAWCPPTWDKELFLLLCKKPYEERVTIAGALCAAELDRLLYIKNKENEKGN